MSRYIPRRKRQPKTPRQKIAAVLSGLLYHVEEECGAPREEALALVEKLAACVVPPLPIDEDGIEAMIDRHRAVFGSGRESMTHLRSQPGWPRR